MIVFRLATGLRGSHPLPAEARRVRAHGVGGWLSALAVPTKLRLALQKAIVASADENLGAMADALEGVTDITAPHLDRVARFEMSRLIAALRLNPAPLAAVAHHSVE